jgi:D-glycero-D-manno-heptose 1,7-bisphosphate phosphatase
MKVRPRVIFLDRDGTLMEDAHYIKSPDQVRLLPGAGAAVRRINEARIPAIVVTNQSGIGRGLFGVADYEAVRSHFESLLRAEGARIDASYFCPHPPGAPEACTCRKPGTGMFEDALRERQLQPERAAYIGDRWRDVVASKRLGGRGIMVESAVTTAEDRRLAQEDGIEIVPTILEAVSRLLDLPAHAGSS